MPSFPASPTNGQTYTSGSRSWVYASATKTWDLVQGPVAHKSTHATGGSDALTAADIGAIGSASPTFTGTVTAPTLYATVLSQNVYNFGNTGNTWAVSTDNGTVQFATLTGTASQSPYSGVVTTITLPSYPTVSQLTLIVFCPDASKRGYIFTPGQPGASVFANNSKFTTPAASSSYSIIQCYFAGGNWIVNIIGPLV